MKICSFFDERLMVALVVLFSWPFNASSDTDQKSMGFDCSRLPSPVEQMICIDSYLLSLDRYTRSLSRTIFDLEAFHADLAKAQGKFLEAKNKCADKSCLVKNYHKYIDVLVNARKEYRPQIYVFNPQTITDEFDQQVSGYEPVDIKEVENLEGGITKLFPNTPFAIEDPQILSFECAQYYQCRYVYSFIYVSDDNKYPMRGSFQPNPKGGITTYSLSKKETLICALKQLAEE